jgi:hypothetical protein
MEAIVIGAAAAIVGVLSLVALVNRRESRNGDSATRVPIRDRGEPFSWTYTTASRRLIDALGELGLHLVEDNGRVKRFEGGSQAKTRLLGGYFVKPRDLPVTVLVAPVPGLDAYQSIEVRDRIGPIGLRDRALAARYAMRADEIQQGVDAVEPR